VTLATATTIRDAYQAALLAIAGGQEYTIGGRTLKRADAAFVEKTFEKYDRMVAALSSGPPAGVRLTRIIPRDL